MTSPVLSRDASAPPYPWNATIANANPWCRIPGSPFSDGLVLVPNHPDREAVCVTYGPFDLLDSVDTFSFLFSSEAMAAHVNAIRITASALDDSGATLGETTTSLAYEQRGSATLVLDGPSSGSCVRLRFRVEFDQFEEGGAWGSVKVLYVLAYRRNLLVELFNKTRSDKGTTGYWGRGVPHCYALEYHRLFEPFRADRFALLEIGLDNSKPPADAPSLRVWREYFPNAVLYGYDIEDFSFFLERETVIFRGDQGSRDDLRRFLSEHPSTFRIVIDDGSHASSHQQTSFAALFPYVDPGGMYVIEDLNWQPVVESPTTLDVLRGFDARAVIESPFMTEGETRYLNETVASVAIYRPNDSDVAVVEKKMV